MCFSFKLFLPLKNRFMKGSSSQEMKMKRGIYYIKGYTSEINKRLDICRVTI